MIIRNDATNTYSVVTGEKEKTGSEKLLRSGIRTKQDARDYELSITDFRQKESLRTIDHEADFDELLDAFLCEKHVRVRQSTYVSYDVILNRFIRPAFTGKKLNEIDSADVRAWQNGMLKLDYSPRYLRKVDSLLCSVFKYGVRFFGMKTNPAKFAGSIGSCNSEKINFWTLEEFAEFIRHVNDQRFHLIYDILYWTGMRVGEVLALTPADIDLEERSININKTYRRYHREDIISPPKTKKSYRKVFINKALNMEIAEYLAERPRIDNDERLFTIGFDAVRDRLERTARRAGVKRIKIHDLRHSHASLLISMNVTPLMVSERLGHEKVETTLNIYTHLYPDMQRRLADSLDCEFEKARGTKNTADREPEIERQEKGAD